MSLPVSWEGGGRKGGEGKKEWEWEKFLVANQLYLEVFH